MRRGASILGTSDVGAGDTCVCAGRGEGGTKPESGQKLEIDRMGRDPGGGQGGVSERASERLSESDD